MGTRFGQVRKFVQVPQNVAHFVVAVAWTHEECDKWLEISSSVRRGLPQSHAYIWTIVNLSGVLDKRHIYR